MRIDLLVFEESPRLNGQDPEHTRLLAEADGILPPIMVHRPTMRVIDGAHRVQAALLNGKSLINARLLDCDESTVFILAVKANVTHGLPLTPADRRAAAARIIATHPHWSDRAVAVAAGLSDKTVSAIRACSTAEASQSNARLGQDGRVRPLDSADRRRHAAAIITERPEAGLREIARATGLSPATVRNVRQRISSSEDPVPPRYRPAANAGTSPASSGSAGTSGTHTRRRDGHLDRRTLLAKLTNDPSLRFKEAGRRTLRWLHQHTVDSESCESLHHDVPDHCAPVVADLARSCALSWSLLAERLDERVKHNESCMRNDDSMP